MAQKFILTVTCEGRPGLVKDVTTLLFACGGNILEAQQFDDQETGRFFMRIVFESAQAEAGIRAGFGRLGREAGLGWALWPASVPPKVLILVSSFDHCMGDLVYRRRIGELAMDIVGIVSNHPLDAARAAMIGDIPYHHLPITSDTKPGQEARIKSIVGDTGAELVILARYMQILSDDLAAFLAGRCINIHHSFLPGFKGAKPYHQAYDRGVKMIGATAHYVTAELDEGPIIAQDVEAISHADTPADLVRKGRDIERRVLAAAVRAHLARRVLLNGAKTVVF